jgi:hypothetical protein
VADEDVNLAVLLVPPDRSISTSADRQRLPRPGGVLDVVELGEIGGQGADVQLPRVAALELDRDGAVGLDLGRDVHHGVMLSASCRRRQGRNVP